MHDLPDQIRDDPLHGGAFSGAGSRAHIGFEVGLLAVVALGFRLIDLGHPPFIDEMHHLLAAESLLRDGTTTIYDGTAYTRGLPFTYLVAGAIALFGESLEVARLPAVAAGTALVCLAFLWMRREAGRIAGWTAALLLCFAPVSLSLSQWVRFYTLHALAFWAGVYCVYRLVERRDPPRRRWWVGAAALVALLVAFDLQVTTAIGIGGLALYAGLVEVPRFVTATDSTRGRRHRAGGIVLLVLAGAAAFWLVGGFGWLAGYAAKVDFWATGRARMLRFYHWLFMEQFGFLWMLLPVAALVALTARGRLGLLLACVFGVGILAHSLVAWKGERYVFYLLPAWLGIWGLAAGEALPRLWHRLEAGARAAFRGLPERANRGIVGAALVVALLFAASTVTAYTTSRLIYVQGVDWSPPPGHTGERYRDHPDWKAVVPRLAPMTDSVAVVVGEPDMKVIHYLGDIDFVLYAGYLMTAERVGDSLDDRLPEFTQWRKVGRPLVSEPGSIETLMACYPSGLIVAERHAWGWIGGVPRETAAFIEASTRPLDLPEEAGIVAFRWTTTAPADVGEPTEVVSPDAVPGAADPGGAADAGAVPDAEAAVPNAAVPDAAHAGAPANPVVDRCASVRRARREAPVHHGPELATR